MKREIWTPLEEQLQRLAEDWMDRHMGRDWKNQWESIAGQAVADKLLEYAEEGYGVTAILQWDDDICRFLMTAAVPDRQPDRQCETLTEQLYWDSWGTALMDGGRQLLRDYVTDAYSKWTECVEEWPSGAEKERINSAEEERMSGAEDDMGDDAEKSLRNGENAEETPIANRRSKIILGGPGLHGVPMEEMKPLYEALEGWRIGISINSFGVLLPEKSCGGWFRREKEPADRGEIECCHPGLGCEFCGRYGISCGGAGLSRGSDEDNGGAGLSRGAE
ncbi:MAG: hypothetical protein J6E42_09535 [Firmicutes bacterium]|nr:hypothetical protein [Bacillota bacterium]